MTWSELQEVAQNAIVSELGATMPKTMAERVAKRIVEDVQIKLCVTGRMTALVEGIDTIQEPDSVWSDE